MIVSSLYRFADTGKTMGMSLLNNKKHMALLDYKIVRLSRDKRHIEATVRVYRGAITTEEEENPATETLENVTRYRRIAKVLERNFVYDIPRDMTRAEFILKARAYLNKKLIGKATELGHTVITEQQDLTDYEEVSNDTKI